VFNALSWPRQVQVQTPSGLREVTAPACGWTTVPPVNRHSAGTAGGVSATERCLENEHLRAEFNEPGELVSLFDKDSSREVMASPGNRFLLYKDVPTAWDAWDIDSMTEQMAVPLQGKATLENTSSGPLLGQLMLRRQFSASSLTQFITLRRGSRRLEFATTVDWQESHRLLKVAFPVTIHADEATHEIQFGHLKRPTHRSRPFDADRFEVCNHKWSALAEEGRGVAILNDCKYGLSVTGNSLNLTLLKSALAPDMTADKGLQTFTYALYPWNGSLLESNVVREAYELNCPPLLINGAAREAERSIFSIDAPNVIIETVKPAEDGSSAIVVRLYEAMRTATRCTLTTTLPIVSAAETDLLEGGPREVASDGGRMVLDFRPFEIKTVKLALQGLA